jgi:hypothetical protein
VDTKDNTERVTKHNWSKARQEFSVLGIVPIGREPVWSSDVDRFSVELKCFGRLEPRSERLFRHLLAGSVEDSRPYFGR